MDQTLVQKICAEINRPIIGIIGATAPTPPYKKEIGREVGYKLREYLASHSGTLFTGGVDGVGVDVYTGVLRYCIYEATQQGTFPDDHFFVLIPKYCQEPKGFLARSPKQYSLPNTYHALSSLTRRGEIHHFYAGENMAQRRDYVSAIADVLVVINGGGGTFNEAIHALHYNKPLLALSSSGGAAHLLEVIKTTESTPHEIAKQIGEMRIDCTTLNRALISSTYSANELIQSLDKLLS